MYPLQVNPTGLFVKTELVCHINCARIPFNYNPQGTN